MKSSGIGGQAVLEGVMMRHKTDIAVAVRKPDGSIEVGKQKSTSPAAKHKVLGWPIIRGVVSFIYSLIIGFKTLSYSADFYEEEEESIKDKANGVIKEQKMEDKETSKGEKALLGVSLVIGLVIALVLFMFLPYWISALIVRLTGLESETILAIIEGVIKLAIFIAYVWAISLMDDIKRTFMYHGAEHKCINCIESGKELTVENVMASSKEHRRCGTSFIVFVLIISIIFFIFIRVDNTWLRMFIRLLLIPVIAGVSYEFIQWAGNSDSKAAAILSRPGLWVQALTTREPTPDMAEVGIASVEAVFDWRGYLRSQGIEVPDPEPEEETEDPEAETAQEESGPEEADPGVSDGGQDEESRPEPCPDESEEKSVPADDQIPEEYGQLCEAEAAAESKEADE